MRFSVEWLTHAENANAEERATLCAMQIVVGDSNVSNHVHLGDNELWDHLELPAVHLAEGIASSWWFIFGGRDVTHRLFSWRTGFALPAICFEFDGSTMAVSCQASVYENPPLEFWKDGLEYLPRCQAEEALSTFVDQVVRKVRANGPSDATEVALAWNRVLESRAKEEETVFCEAAGALGIDPYAIEETDANFIERAGEEFEGEALIEFLAGFSRLPRRVPRRRDARRRGEPGSRQETLDWVRDLRFRPRNRSLLRELPNVAAEIGKTTVKDSVAYAWTRGYRTAEAFRNVMGLNGMKPLSIAQLAKMLGCGRFERVHGPQGLYAVVGQRDDGVHIHLRFRGRTRWAGSTDRFVFARAIGDAICFPESTLSAINALHKAERQAVGRAFAAELLAPVKTVLDMDESGLDTDEIADILDVGTAVVERQLENQDRILDALSAQP